ncbi:MAG: 1-deoxy-D-xylulose-5-phosphate synthase [Candidatus Adiutrix sp.]|jgi:1-deoxy-D-xylulose-5-phosphate synthase|nr:1-deoxy-D-xylulose-5-phosphate synthase [Candidatus Adiutrix sp.]
METRFKTPTPLLDRIDRPEDLKKIAREDLPRLAEEIRGEIIRVVSQNGGHLASSLGAVELIMALHYVFNAPRDKIIFDVGHQAYAHKLLTGRRKDFEALRREGGLSGFPRRAESVYDAFDAGHSSTAVSAALGLAVARDLAGEEHVVAAVMGDGSMTGGMAFEAMNHAGALKKRLLIILNDNNMSISRNVGGLSEYLSLWFTRPEHVSFRKKIKEILREYLPSRGQQVIEGVKKVEEAIKSVLTRPSIFFEAMGFKYMGPFDGHDAATLIDALRQAAGLDQPVLLHVITTKGKGYSPAENDPSSYHGVSAQGSKAPAAQKPEERREKVEVGEKNFSDAFGEMLLEAAENNERIAAISAAMSQGVGLERFFAKFPERSFDVGIAEQHAVTLAAGLAAGGFRPVAAIYSSFLQRAFDQLFHDVALQNLPVLLAVDRAGPVGEDGPTHHGGLDLSYLRLLPNFTVMAPADLAELQAMLRLALTLDGPSAIRYPRGPAPAGLAVDLAGLTPGRGVVLKAGTDISLMALGPPAAAALLAAGRLEQMGHSASVVNLRFIKPLDRELVQDQAARTGRILTVEENLMSGGLFGAVSETLGGAGRGRGALVRGLGLTDAPVVQAPQSSQRAALGLDVEGIVKTSLELLRK